MKQITRLGVYGIILQENRIVLTTKVKGYYKGLLDLPGGGMDFGEAPEETLRREIKEELGMSFAKASVFDNLSHLAKGRFPADNSEEETYHHLGHIYWVYEPCQISGADAEDPWDWYSLDIDLEKLTPFAKAVVKRLKTS